MLSILHGHRELAEAEGLEAVAPRAGNIP